MKKLFVSKRSRTIFIAISAIVFLLWVVLVPMTTSVGIATALVLYGVFELVRYYFFIPRKFKTPKINIIPTTMLFTTI